MLDQSINLKLKLGTYKCRLNKNKKFYFLHQVLPKTFYLGEEKKLIVKYNNHEFIHKPIFRNKKYYLRIGKKVNSFLKEGDIVNVRAYNTKSFKLNNSIFHKRIELLGSILGRGRSNEERKKNIEHILKVKIKTIDRPFNTKEILDFLDNVFSQKDMFKLKSKKNSRRLTNYIKSTNLVYWEKKGNEKIWYHY